MFRRIHCGRHFSVPASRKRVEESEGKVVWFCMTFCVAKSQGVGAGVVTGRTQPFRIFLLLHEPFLRGWRQIMQLLYLIREASEDEHAFLCLCAFTATLRSCCRCCQAPVHKKRLWFFVSFDVATHIQYK